MPLTKMELVALAKAKRTDAALLLANRRWPSAYYLYGFCIELGIKAAIAGRVPAQTIQDKNFGNLFYSHDLRALIGLAGLGSEIAAKTSEARFKANWEIVADWKVESRYQSASEDEARTIASAVDARRVGVFAWLKTLW